MMVLTINDEKNDDDGGDDGENSRTCGSPATLLFTTNDLVQDPANVNSCGISNDALNIRIHSQGPHCFSWHPEMLCIHFCGSLGLVRVGLGTALSTIDALSMPVFVNARIKACVHSYLD